MKLSSIFNFFASLFAAGVYSYSYYINPYQTVGLPGWYYFLSAAAVMTIVYFSLFFYHKAKVEKGERKAVVVINFCLYILIFCTLTFGFAILKTFKEDMVVHGRVLASNGLPSRKADIQISTIGNSKFTLSTDSKGQFTLFLDRKYKDSIQHILIADRQTGESFEANTFGEGAVFTVLSSDITLTKQ
jgi:hypothetical protein